MDLDSAALQTMTRKLRETQERLLLVQAELGELEVTGTAGGGLVAVRMRGTGEITHVHIDQAAVDQSDAEALSSLTLAAIRQATQAVKAATTEKVTIVSQSLPGLATPTFPA